MKLVSKIDMLKIIGRRIQTLRKRVGITQEELAERTGLNTKHISAIEQGKKNLTVKTATKIAEGLQVELFEIFIIEGENELSTLKEMFKVLLEKADKKKLKLYFSILKVIENFF